MSAHLAVVPQPDDSAPLLSAWVPADLRAALESGGVILLLGRNSNSGGAAGRRAAVNNCLDAAALLATYGIELRHLLPTAAELEERLRGDAIVVKFTDTKNKRRELRSIEVHPTPGIVLVIQQGTGVAYPKGTGIQPAADRVADAVRDVRPVLLAAMEVRSSARNGYAWAPIISALEQQLPPAGPGPLYYVDSRLTLTEYGDHVRTHVFTEGERARDEAGKTRERMLRGARRSTDRTSEAGRFRYGFGVALPPPFDIVRRKNFGGAVGEVWAVLDCPECRFPESELAVGQGQPEEATNRPARADQVELVRWFYRHYLQPDWTVGDVARYLIDHGFSTYGVRKLHQNLSAQQQLKPDTVQTDAVAICGSIVEHIQFHATGDLLLPLNEDGTMVSVHIEHPDARPLCTPEDRARIEQAQTGRRGTAAPARLFSGHAATVNGQPGWLISVKDDGTDDPAYTVARDDGLGRRAPQRVGAPYIRHAELVHAIAEAAKETALLPSVPSRDAGTVRDADEHVAGARARLRRAERAVEALEQALLSKVLTLSADKLANDKYNHACAERDQASRALAAAERARSRLDIDTGVPAAQWFDLLVHILDARDHAYRGRIKNDLSPLIVTTRPAPEPAHPNRVVLDFEAKLALLDQDGRAVALPIRGTTERLSHGSAADTVRGADLLLRSGSPMSKIATRDKTHLGKLLRTSWGHQSASLCRAISIRDPRLLRLTLAACHPQRVLESTNETGDGFGDTEGVLLAGPQLSAQAIWRLADRLGEPRTLLKHLVRLHEQPPADGSWLIRTAPTAQGVLDRAATVPITSVPTWIRFRIGHLLEVTAEGLRTVQCPHCGSRDRVLPRIAEIIGLVCRSCRRDDAGHLWPKDPYDGYLSR